MSRKKIKVRYETYYSLTPDACEALGLNHDENRPATMADILAAKQGMEERQQCKSNEEEEDQL